MKEIIENQKTFFKTDQTKSIYFRIKALESLRKTIIEYEHDIIKALHYDLNKAPFETYMTEIGVTLLEIKHTIKHLRKWMKPKKVRTPLTLFKAKSKIIYEPYGQVLVIAPWNYPFQLVFAPLIGAIAAGNCVVIKPSEFSSETAKIIEKICEKAFQKEHVTTVLGGIETSEALLEHRFDYIFFTGSTTVGQIIMEKASKHLTPVTLELGGKSPVIISENSNIDLAAKRVAFGKIINAGQTCIAPDYVFIHKNVKHLFLESYKTYIEQFVTKDPLSYDEYPKIISDKHYKRLVALYDKEEVLLGGAHKNQKVEPTVVHSKDFSSKIMQEEIFGPILPLIEYEDLDQVIKELKNHEKPLALYIFSNEKAEVKKIEQSLSFGGMTINDTIMHVAHPNLPFGGVGQSGIGQYHGIYSFLTFSHQKAVLNRSILIDLNFRYHPYTEKKKRILKMFLK